MKSNSLTLDYWTTLGRIHTIALMIVLLITKVLQENVTAVVKLHDCQEPNCKIIVRHRTHKHEHILLSNNSKNTKKINV